MEMVVFITWKLCDRACMNIQYEIKRVNDVSHILNKMWQEEKKEKKRGKKKEKWYTGWAEQLKPRTLIECFSSKLEKNDTKYKQ